MKPTTNGTGWINFSRERPAELWKDGGWHPVRLRVLGDPVETQLAKEAYSARFTSTAERLDRAVLIASRAR